MVSNDVSKPLQLELLLYKEELTVYKFPKDYIVPPSLLSLPWVTISKTNEEVSITAPTSSVDAVFKDDQGPGVALMEKEEGWRILKIDSILDFNLVGILATIVTPLKNAGIPVFVISTFNTDYILVKRDKLDEAVAEITKQTSYKVKQGEATLL